MEVFRLYYSLVWPCYSLVWPYYSLVWRLMVRHEGRRPRPRADHSSLEAGLQCVVLGESSSGGGMGGSGRHTPQGNDRATQGNNSAGIPSYKGPKGPGPMDSWAHGLRGPCPGPGPGSPWKPCPSLSQETLRKNSTRKNDPLRPGKVLLANIFGKWAAQN